MSAARPPADVNLQELRRTKDFLLSAGQCHLTVDSNSGWVWAVLHHLVCHPYPGTSASSFNVCLHTFLTNRSWGQCSFFAATFPHKRSDVHSQVLVMASCGVEAPGCCQCYRWQNSPLVLVKFRMLLIQVGLSGLTGVEKIRCVSLFRPPMPRFCFVLGYLGWFDLFEREQECIFLLVFNSCKLNCRSTDNSKP